MAFLSVRRPDLIFERFNYLSNPNAKQDCINGLELLFSKCESLCIDGLYCKSLLLHPNLNQFVHQLRKIKICNSDFQEMLSLPEERRPTPSDVKLHSEYETDFINFAQVESLHLKQGTCEENLKRIADQLLCLKTLHIEHCGAPDYTLFSVPNNLPQNVKLRTMLHHCRKGTQQDEEYSTSAILRQWEPKKCIYTEVLINTEISFDFKVVVEDGINTIKSTKSPNNKELKEKLRRFHVREFSDDHPKKLCIQDSETKHTILIIPMAKSMV